MSDKKRAFTLIELLVVIAIIAILAAILFPVFAQARASARTISCLSNTKQYSLGVLMYAQDYDEVIPQLDNNGISWLEPNGLTPDWGDATLSPLGLQASKVMFSNVVVPYIKNHEIGYCPELGRTNWPSAVGAAASSGIVYGGPYDPQKVDVYYGVVGQMAINIRIIRLWSRVGGNLAAMPRPAETVMLAGDSVWDYDSSMSLSVGNTGVWPSYPGTPCTPDVNSDTGWVWYAHRGEGRRGKAASVSGLANIAWVDGHAKAMKRNNLERCEFNPALNAWGYTLWEPRIQQ